eukprot:CAMPEP_0177751804 /NCGR_PEP_ID=MMETSP0491_2-20121128/576_1 /TAXON_ID=63592 /ORGANISM="Tetraselmis chuii, Strain PLY429" /LENGTH=390 /DNA_ID=CAMNT_0019266955 /DNA_START=218 /DNA_END=1388 /DNA_ORIENTATION=-
MAGALSRFAVRLSTAAAGSPSHAILTRSLASSPALSTWSADTVLQTCGDRTLVARDAPSLSLRFAEHGEAATVVKLEEVELGQTGPKDVLVDFLAAPINPSDLNIIEGKYPLKPSLPATPGNEGVALVREIGSEVDSNYFKPGDRVVPLEAGFGTWRTSAVLPADCLYRVPSNVPTLTAATLTINPPTALCLLDKFVHLQPGATIIQNGANSAVGQAVIELATARKINTINIIRERPDWDEVSSHLRSIGATVVTTLDQALAASAHMPKPELALNCVGGPSATKLAKMLSHGGTIVTYGGMSLQPVTIPTPLLIFKDIRARGFALSINCSRAEKAALLEQLIPMAQKGAFSSQRFETYAIEDFKSALQRASEPFRGGKVVLELPAYDTCE